MPKYFLYIMKSFFHRFRTHVGFIIILSCAFVLPIVFTIVLDSANYGILQQNFHLTGGSDFRIENSEESDLSYYSDVEGITAFFDNGIIYINATTALTRSARIELGSQLFSRTIESGNDKLEFVDISFDTSTQETFMAQWLIMLFLMIGFCMLIIQVAYSTHIGNFKAEIGVLESIGASRKQIKKIFLAEILISYIFALLLSFTFSYLGTFLLFKYFLQIEDSETMMWVIFHIDGIHMVILALILLIFLLVMFLFKFRIITKVNTVTLLSSTMNDERLKHYRKVLKISDNPVLTLSKMLLQRSKKVFVHSVIITIPILTTAVFLFNYSNIYMDILNQKPGYDVIVQKNPTNNTIDDTFNFSYLEFSNQQKDAVKSMPGIQNIEFETDIAEGEYVILSDNAIEITTTYPFISIGEQNYILINVEAFFNLSSKYIDSITGDTDQINGKMNVAVSKNYAFANYAVGDEIYLYRRSVLLSESEREYTHDEHDEYISNIVLEPIKLKVVALIDTPFSDESMAIYFNDQDYNNLTHGMGANIMKIILDQDTDDVLFCQKLSTLLGDPKMHEIMNEKEKARIKSKTSIGVFILMEGIACLVFFFMLITLFMLLSEYIRRQKKNIASLFVLGASKRDISNIYMRQASIVVVFCLLVSIILGVLLSILFFAASGYYMAINLFIVLSYSIAISVVLVAFMLPVHMGLRKQLQKL